MKIITRFEMQWDAELQRYVVTAEDSYQYAGPVALCGGGGGKGGGGDGGAGAMRDQENARQAKLAETTKGINDQFAGFDDNYFNGISDAYLKFQQPLLEEQVTKARKDLPYQFASTDGSAYQTKLGELERDVLREQANLRDKAVTVGNDQRGEVERNRSDLVSMANAGTDASAVASMSAARSAALAKPAPFNPITDLFQKYTAGLANATIAGNQGGYGMPVQPRPLLFQPSKASGSQRVVS